MQQDNPLAFPSKVDRERLAQYDYYDKLYNGDHFEAFSIRGEEDFNTNYNKLRYVVSNFAGLMSHVMADMLFGEKVTIDFKDDTNQTFADALINENQLINQLYESALGNSRRGDSLFKVRIGQRNPSLVASKSTVIIEEITPSIYFPSLEQSAVRYTPSQDVLGWVFKQDGRTYLHKETHMAGYIFHEIWGYNENTHSLTLSYPPEQFGFAAQEDTGIDRSLIFHIPNFRDGNGFWGTSDYKGLTSLFFAINNRITKMDNILDKHSDPILAVPPGVLDEEGGIRKESLGMFEVANDQPGFNKPEYIVWNANLEAAEKQVDRLIDLLFTMSEISPTSAGRDDQGGAGRVESGRALKFKLLASIRKRNRKIRYYDFAIKDMLETALELASVHNVTVKGLQPGNPDQPVIDWGDGVINDSVEQTDTEIKRVDAGLSSRADSIARLDGLTPDEARDKVKEIDEENSADLSSSLANRATVDASGQPILTPGVKAVVDQPKNQTPANNSNQPAAAAKSASK